VLPAVGAPRRHRTGFPALQERRIASNACGAQNLEPAERIERSSDVAPLARPTVRLLFH